MKEKKLDIGVLFWSMLVLLACGILFLKQEEGHAVEIEKSSLEQEKLSVNKTIEPLYNQQEKKEMVDAYRLYYQISCLPEEKKAKSVKIKNVVLIDTFSKYVDFTKKKANLTVYEETNTGKKSVAESRYAFSYNSENKTVKLAFSEPLESTASYEISFDIQASESGYRTYMKNVLKNLPAYNDRIGDAGTDRTAQGNSMNQAGFPISESALVRYRIKDKTAKIELPQPVLQVHFK